MSGLKRLGACGHVQQAVFNQMFLCIGAPDCTGKPRCPKCGTDKVEPFVSDLCPPGSFHCLPMGHVWWKP